ncbi:MAG: flagellar export chaperone FliS [Acidobacteriota bacterium]|nr:flagellar export chaperone FliS [Acidobacteriota bacterium]
MTHSTRTYFQDEVLSASPLRLVCLLYQGAISEIRDARRNLAGGNVQARSASISKACDILSELTLSLDVGTGGELAANLGGLYAYAITRLLDANLNRADGPLAEVLGLLITLQEGWTELAAAEARPVETVPATHLFAGQNLESCAHSWSF